MFSLRRQRIPDCSALRRACHSAAFTLVEVVIALAVLGAMASGVYLGFNSINAFAVSSRLYSEALTAAQNQIDLTLSKEPLDVNAAYISGSFNPCLNKIPVELMLTTELDALATSTTCGVTFPTAPPSSTPAKTDSYYPYYPYYRTGAGQPLQKQAFIYHDPITGLDVVKGTLTVTVTDTAQTSSFIKSAKLNTRQADVQVTYSFRNRNYINPPAIWMNTLRTADQ